jgi:integrase/recombinase XerD
MRVIRRSQPEPVEPRVWLVDEQGAPVMVVNEFLALLASRGYSPNTIRAYAHDLQKLFCFLGERGVGYEAFSPRLAVEFLGFLRTRLSTWPTQRLGVSLVGTDREAGPGRLLKPRTCNRVLAAVSWFYEFLITTERYGEADNPLGMVPDLAAARAAERYRPPLLRSGKQRPVRRALRVKTVLALPRPMPPEAFQALLGQLRTRRDRAIVQLMHEGGLRPGEVLGLHLDDIAYGRRRVTIRWRDDHPRGVRQKSRRERVVDLHEGQALAALSDYALHERPAEAPTPVVFLVGGAGRRRLEPLGYDALVRMFARAAERAGVREPWLSPHSLRHTHATAMWEQGMRELALMVRLGHASPDSTRVYIQVSDRQLVADYRRAISEEPQ